LNDLKTKIIPHFKKHSLGTSKSNDFNLFVEVVNDVLAKHHLNSQKLRLIIEKSYRINSGKRKFEVAQLISKVIER
jgi:hypothetical protein